MCRSCQYCIESCYWHLIEKRFCYDENIALYDEPIKWNEKSTKTFENMAFYDQISRIAGRAIVTIDPLPKQEKPIEHQPVRRMRWWEDNVDQQNKENEAKNRHQSNILSVASVPTILECSNEDVSSSTEEIDSINNKQTSIEVPENNCDENLGSSTPDIKQSLPADTQPNEKTTSNQLNVDDIVQLRNKSLSHRRMSRSLTLNIDRHLELPIIRQMSMPKFYIDTPEINQTDSSVLMTPSVTLASPVIPHNTQFDLRSVVQIEKEQRTSAIQQNPVPVHRSLSQQFRLSLIKDKLKTNKLMKQASMSNLPSYIHHI